MSDTPGADTLELTPGERLIEGAREALAIARGEIPAARITINGHAYVPETELASLRAEKEELRRERDEARKLAGLGCDAANGGPHAIVKQGTYTFCHLCGSTIKRPTVHERARAAEARAEAAESLLAEAGGIIGRALEELRLIRMKDSGAVYDTTLRLEASAVATRIASLTKEPAHAE